MTGDPSDNKDKSGSFKQVLVGRIGAAHGLKGEVRILSFCAAPLDIASYGPLTTARKGRVEIVKARLQKDMVVATLKGVGDRNAAEALNGVELFIDRDRLPPAEDADDFYYADLIGLAVRAPDGRAIGTLKSIDDYGAGDVVEIALNTGASALYAFTKANFPEIDVEAGYMVLDPPAETEARE
jgi:16S rRNA processing protein RimM